MKDEDFPEDLENMLLEYTINALETKPDDYISHAADYFNRLREKNKNSAPDKEEPSEKSEGQVFFDSDLSPEGSREHISKMLGHHGRSRRFTVMGESYNPEEEEDEADDLDVEINPKTDEERNRIRRAAANIFLFRVLDDSDLTAVIDAMMSVNVEEGQIVIQQGDDGDYFYLVDRGTFDACIKDTDGTEKIVHSYDNEGYFGELALLHNQPRAATIKATSEGSLWAVNRQTFNKLIVKRAFQKRQKYIKLLEGVPALEPLTEYETMQVADALIAKSYSKDAIIVKQGDEGDGMYFIVEGKVSVRQKKPTNDKEAESVEIAQLEEGKFFGELALLEHQPRAATIVAMEDDTKVAFLDVKAFERLLGPCMDIMKRHTKKYEQTSITPTVKKPKDGPR